MLSCMSYLHMWGINYLGAILNNFCINGVLKPKSLRVANIEVADEKIDTIFSH